MNPFANNEEQQQGSEAWHAERAKGIGGSEIAVVLGISPYKTRYQLWLEKTGLVQPADISGLPHVQRGVLAEPVARKKMEDLLGRKYTPKTWPQKGVARCSDDGYNEDINDILEIKAMGIENHQKAHLGEVPEHYRVQCIWNMGVSGANKCYFVSVRPEDDYDIAVVDILPDTAEFHEMVAEAEKFWELVKTKTPPELSDKDCILIEDAIFEADEQEYVELEKKKKDIEARLNELKSVFEERLGQYGSVEGKFLKMTRVNRKGNVNYKNIPELQGVDLEPYRGDNSVYMKVTVKKEKA